MKDEDAGVRVAAAFALGATGDGRAVGALSMAARDRWVPVACASALALACIENASARKVLERVSRDTRPRVRAAAEMGLRQASAAGS